MARMDRELVDAIVAQRPARPDAFYWCVFCGWSAGQDGRFPDGRTLSQHLAGACGKEIMTRLELAEQSGQEGCV